MSEIKISANIDTQDILFQKVDFFAGDTQIHIRFLSSDSITTFYDVDLKYGYHIKYNGGVVDTKSYPSEGIKILECDTNPITSEYFVFNKNSNYELYFWYTLNSEKFDRNFEITTLLPKQPYPSWIWNDNEWVAPIDKPSNHNYQWNENEKKWMINDNQTP